MEADGQRLRQITPLVEASTIMPVIDRVFSFDDVNEALAYVETGRATGKAVIEVKQTGPNAHDCVGLTGARPCHRADSGLPGFWSEQAVARTGEMGAHQGAGGVRVSVGDGVKDG